MVDVQNYIGNELEMFQHAKHWKAYFSSKISPFIKGDVLEVGAGIGGTTETLCTGTERSWTCLEPDGSLAVQIDERLNDKRLPSICKVVEGTIEDLPVGQTFDTILYIDVIEHIEDDRSEVRRAAERLKKGGHLIILVPAFQFFYSPFDKAIGHYRRYNKGRLKEVIPAELVKQEKLFFLDSVGLMASFANKLMLQQSYPTQSQVRLWDNYLVTTSRFIDPILLNSFGKSLIGIWQRK